MGKRKDLKYYLSLPYTIQITREDDSTWFARVVELPGCITEGDTPEEAADMIQDALAAWLEIALEDGRAIPEPQATEVYSGRFVVRVPRTLHRQLVEAAAQEGVSLNQFINVALAGRVTRPVTSSSKPARTTRAASATAR
jgi:antitoxin HicB